MNASNPVQAENAKGDEIGMSQFFTNTDYVMCLPILLLTLFACGILLIDLTVPPEWKWSNAYWRLQV